MAVRICMLFLAAPLEKSVRTVTAVWIFMLFFPIGWDKNGFYIYKIGVVIIMFK